MAGDCIHLLFFLLVFHAGNDSHKVLLQNKEKNFEGFFLLLEKNDEKKMDFIPVCMLNYKF